MPQSENESSAVLITEYGDLVRELAEMISLAKRDIHIAPRYYEPAIGSKIVSRFAEGISIHMLDAKTCGVTFEERLRTASAHDRKNRDFILKLLNTPQALIPVERLDYSFVVVDGHSCGIELVNPGNPDNFYCAIKLENTSLASKLIGLFESLASSQKREKLENTHTVLNSIRQ